MVEVSVLFRQYAKKDHLDDVYLEDAVLTRVLSEKKAGETVSMIKEFEFEPFTFEVASRWIPWLLTQGLISPHEGSRLRAILKDFDEARVDLKGDAASPARCAAVMNYLATPTPQLSLDIQQEVGNIPPALITEFRESLTRLCGRYARFANRLEFNKERQVVDFLKTFAEVAEKVFHKPCRFARKPSGLVDIKGDELEGNREVGLALARSGVIDMSVELVRSLNTVMKKCAQPKYVPRRIATIWGGVQRDQVAVYIRCGALVGKNFAIEYEIEEKACLYTAGSDMSIDEEFVRRLLWLSPFDITTIATTAPEAIEDSDDDDNMCVNADYSHEDDYA
eukprot:Gregarina_sp_Pseudo_9__609@NODE_1390_length_1640_cov_14_567770_g1296_i0_p1_GENE_NODE_1390_length_1640_cov_14_567770_g1296_i0NODE_1390_length_1640_cov_14_567770_g1296_i0_p1_ORF_typecomplete_len336_score30_97DUF2180/PF09947_9/0_11_NODE_1390_length_1640_cov_14_567770_g1296_i0951102